MMNDRSQPSAPAVILVEPQMGENIGMCARAMLNCGVRELRIVNPRDGWPNPAALATASGASDLIENAQIYDTTKAAVADLNYVVATTARPRDMVKKVFTAAKAGHELHTRQLSGQTCGILFGRERTGLENDEIALSSAVVTFPMNPDFSSLNLAQAVLLLCYEWRKTVLGDIPPSLSGGKAQPVAHKDLDFFFTRLKGELESHGFFTNPDNTESIWRNIQSIFARNDLTDQEVKTLHGIISSLIK